MDFLQIIKDFGTPLSICTTVGIYFIKNRATQYANRLKHLHKLIRINFYYASGRIPPPNVISTIMDMLNSINEIFDMNESLISMLNGFINSHYDNIPYFEKHRRLVALELEMAKQCYWWFQFNKFKTSHSIDKIATYIPEVFIDVGVTEYFLHLSMLKHFQSLEADRNSSAENLSKNT